MKPPSALAAEPGLCFLPLSAGGDKAAVAAVAAQPMIPGRRRPGVPAPRGSGWRDRTGQPIRSEVREIYERPGTKAAVLRREREP